MTCNPRHRVLRAPRFEVSAEEALTHTPSPMRWLNEVLDRPAEERAFVVVPVGYAAENATVPDIGRKRLDEVLIVD